MTDYLSDIAARLSHEQADFLGRVCERRGLNLANRAEDRVRQSVRRLGLVEVLKGPRRWVATDTGLSVFALRRTDTAA